MKIKLWSTDRHMHKKMYWITSLQVWLHYKYGFATSLASLQAKKDWNLPFQPILSTLTGVLFTHSLSRYVTL